jgi:hypothetical protein
MERDRGIGIDQALEKANMYKINEEENIGRIIRLRFHLDPIDVITMPERMLKILWLGKLADDLLARKNLKLVEELEAKLK